MSDKHPEIVIIRRGGHGEHDEHHGGVWKIAFADFMTAMMAFFLVLWLISANDKTRASVARYFNPVRLVDATTQPRGLHDSKKDDSGITASPDTKDKSHDDKKNDNDKKAEPQAPAGETPKGRDKRLDAELRDNPYVALAEIVGDKGPGDDSQKGAASPDPAIGHGGAAFRDPFAPPPPSATSASTVTASSADDPKDDDEAMAPAQKPAAASDAVAPAAAAPKTPTATATPSPADARTDGADRQKAEKQAKELATLATELKGLDKDKPGPTIAVQRTPDGILLSLTDTDKFAMFANGSAVPSRRVVLMMDKIATLLASKPGPIVIRGFTDNKKFKPGRNDNWRLSLDRAQVAHYMLARGGLPDDRFSHVEGYADHGTATGLDPASPQNRRIEILLKDATP